ncbi:hypothetical protein IU427_25755 [Nocardia beijingensis]|uniref:hypothetical protein n=1 Tax=Nocardia beijingensis TaxID=95162 RepID=UPI0018947933|nr:hypothetical protein [Nocardia beijingensis]MBF6468540.1 hypothetical protein [Nocardia beijingensis]
MIEWSVYPRGRDSDPDIGSGHDIGLTSPGAQLLDDVLDLDPDVIARAVRPPVC